MQRNPLKNVALKNIKLMNIKKYEMSLIPFNSTYLF